jgi:hypothetical protein
MRTPAKRTAFLASCRYCLRPENLRATIRIALVVGVVLTGVNEGDTLASRHLSSALAFKIPLNFIVPFLVSNLGLLAGRPGGHE